jgi:hypothetical protein
MPRHDSWIGTVPLPTPLFSGFKNLFWMKTASLFLSSSQITLTKVFLLKCFFRPSDWTRISVVNHAHRTILRETPFLPCAVESSIKPRFTDFFLEINHVHSHISFDKTGFHTSNRRSLLSDFEL